MKRRGLKKLLIIAFVIAVIAFAVFIVAQKSAPETPVTVPQEVEATSRKVIGRSAEDRTIEAYTFGNGPTHLLFVGGIHGGYEWNSVLLAYQFIDYLSENPGYIPNDITITIIPSANPDGIFRVIKKEGRFTIDDVPLKTANGEGRLNAHEVDLNRNFDCKWQSKGIWKNKPVSAGTSPFSEPETQAIRDHVREFSPKAVVFWHSKASAVYASECEHGILPKTIDIMNAYSRASGYRAIRSFDSYKVSGDAEGWLASMSIPAITVELSTHETVEWEKNLAGFWAIVKYFSIPE